MPSMNAAGTARKPLHGSPGAPGAVSGWSGLPAAWSNAARTVFASAGLLFAASLLAAPSVEVFSPRGEVKDIRQATARFTTPMVPFGDPRLVEPFEIACPVKGSGRWADSRHWVYDFERDLPAGLVCSFKLRDGLADHAGDAVTPAAFDFTTGGPAIRESLPGEGETTIDERQVFMLGLDAIATEASIARHAWCDISGRAERVAVRVLGGKEKKSVLDRQRDFVSRVGSMSGDPAMERAAAAREYDRLPIALVACRTTLPYEAEIRLVWGRGIATADGVATREDQAIAYKVRPAFTAKFSCQRTNAKGQCIPVLPMGLDFTAPVSVALASKITLTGPDGKVWKPKLSDADRQSGFVENVMFPATYVEAASFRITLPTGFVDDGGRPLSNAKRFPLAVRTDPAPPLAKFAARFGIVELNADPALPITVRNVEPALVGTQSTVAGVAARKGLPARVLRVQDPREILAWMKRLDAAEARWTDGGYVSQSVFRATDATRPLTVPRPGDAKQFEVIGIPLPQPGFHVVEVVSPRLGQALLKDGKPYHVSAGALVTNLAVHFKRGRESSLVWVTTLDRGEPAANADVTVMDCAGKSYFEGRTDASGIARVRRVLPVDDALPGCRDKWDKQLFVSARRAGDASFVFSGWNDGIDTWRFNLRRDVNYQEDSVATVFDRTLLRAGDTVGMKHFWRRRTGTGFAFAPKSALPVRAVVRHNSTDARWELPLAWDASGNAESTWTVPKDAKLGEYSVTLAGPKTKQVEDWVEGRDSGSFRVEEFRVPAMKATVQLPATPQVRIRAIDASVQLAYLSGGGAGGHRVKLRAMTQPKSVSFAAHDGVRFANGDVKEGRTTDSGMTETGDDETAEPVDVPTEESQTKSLRTRALVLDAGGAARATLDDIPATDVPRELVVEAEYADPNGQTLTRSARTTLWPSAAVLGVVPDGWALSKDRVKITVIAVDTSGKPLADLPVTVDLMQRESFSHRKRLIGGFYAYEYGEEVKRLGEFCKGRTDARGRLPCEAPAAASGNVILRAKAADAAGNPAFAHAEAWVAGEGEWWFEQGNDDRMDLIPERRRYEPGETAVFQVRAPFRKSTALVTVEREGVVDGFVTTLSGKAPVVKVPVKGHYAPNTYVSVLAVRGRVADVQPTALVDLGKPAFRLGIATIDVGWKAHELKVSVATDREVYRVREKVKVSVDVQRSDGTRPPKGTEIALAAVDEALLELLPNDSWKLLDTMMQARPIEVETSTAAMQVVGKRHYGRKAMAPGGGGGRQGTRELFDTLLAWKGRVKLDERGHADIEVPLNDALSGFRFVAIASGGANFFGTGHASVRTTQDVQLTSGLPPLVRDGDRYAATVTVRNASDRVLDLRVSAEIASVPARKSTAATLDAQTVQLQPGEARNVSWDTSAPVNVESLQWRIVVDAGAGSAPLDQLKIVQKVIPAVPVRTLQATLAQVDGSLAMPIALPSGAVPGRGEVRVHLRSRLADELSGVQEYMSRYPFTCLEQRASKAVALRDEKAWGAVMASLPSHLDRDGLARYFPMGGEGSDTLTAYLLAISDEAGWDIPEPARTQMQDGLRNFVQGKIVRHGSLPTADLVLRKIAALEALSRRATELDPALAGSFTIEPNLWPTSGVIDWLSLAARWTALPDRDRLRAEARRSCGRA